MLVMVAATFPERGAKPPEPQCSDFVKNSSSFDHHTSRRDKIRSTMGRETGRHKSEMTQEKKPYSSPELTELTREQAIKRIAERRNCSEEEAAEFLKHLRKQQPHEATDKERKRSA
jgi:hypothetical protein